MDYKKIIRWAKRASESEVRSLFFAVYGATFAGAVTVERARQLVISACQEMLEQGKMRSSQYNHSGQEMKTMAEITNEMLLNEIRAMSKAITEKIMDIDASVNVLARKMLTVDDHGFTHVGTMEQKPKKGKVSKVVETFVPVALEDGTKKLVEKKEEKAEVPTIEKLREVATKYSTAFGMNDLVSLFKRMGAPRGKLSEVEDKKKDLLLATMEQRLQEENGGSTKVDPLAEVVEVEELITMDTVKSLAKKFMDANGRDPLVALLKSFGVAKVTEVPAEKLAALAEALSNA